MVRRMDRTHRAAVIFRFCTWRNSACDEKCSIGCQDADRFETVSRSHTLNELSRIDCMDFPGAMSCTATMERTRTPVRSEGNGERDCQHTPTLVVVHSAWNGWRTAWIRLADLDDIHWSQPIGAPRSLMHASILCSAIVFGSLPHPCLASPAPHKAPHKLRICILKSHNDPSVFEELSRRATLTHAFPDRAQDELSGTMNV
jgi:hypothetical protein